MPSLSKHSIKIIFICYSCFIASCDTKPRTLSAIASDSIISRQDSLRIREEVDSTTQSIIKDALFDTAGLSTSPVKVVNTRLVKREYSNYKDISITYKNVSGKDISAIRFKWYGLNAFDEPADMGIGSVIDKGFGSGFTDDELRSGKTSSGEWEILSQDAKKVVLAWPYEVVFTDGSKWKTSSN